MKKEWKQPEILELGTEKTEKGAKPNPNIDHWEPQGQGLYIEFS
ncbi:MAG: hypothetical protein ACRC57_13765 [Sarcina sp.]